MTHEQPDLAPPASVRESLRASLGDATGFVVGITVLGAIAVLASTPMMEPFPAPLPLLLAVAVIALGDLPIVHVRHGEENHTFTWSEAALVAGLVLLPAWWVPIVGAATVAFIQIFLRRAPIKVAFNSLSFGAAAFLATIAYETLAAREPTAGHWLALAIACTTYFLWNTITVSIAVALSRGMRVGEVLRTGIALGALFALANSSVAILIATAATREPLVILAIPPVVVQLLFAYRNTREVIGERDLWIEVQGVAEQLQRSSIAELPTVALDAVVRLTGAETVELVTVQGGSAVLHRRVGGSIESVAGPVLELAADVWGRVECDRTRFWLHLGGASSRQERWLRTASVQCAMVLPLEWCGEVVGLLRIGYRSEIAGAQRMESVLSTIGTQLASTIASHRHTETLLHQAEHDQLTTLPNRTLLVKHLADRLARTRENDTGLAVLFFDLDGFKVVNDSLGHHVGDDLLLEASRRLKSQMRPGDMVARFGGDEFVVVCDELGHPSEAADICRRLLRCLTEPGSRPGGSIPLSASVGIAYAAADADPETLLRDADAAMYQAKRTGPGSFCLFSSELRTQVLDRLHLEADLREALANGDLDVHYQPIVDVRTGAVREFEALVRWTHPDRGLVSPPSFVGVAEETGQIRALGEFVLHRACADMRRWFDLGLVEAGQRMAVNLSAIQLDASLPSVVGDALARHGLPAAALTLEVTETALVDDPAAVAALERLRAMGIRVSLDDFGTGYSSLSALRDLPVDTVKVDRSFVSRLGEEPRLDALVSGIVNLAHALEMEVVGEGVELPSQALLLAEAGCDLAQGWLHGRPMAAGSLEALLACSGRGPARAGRSAPSVESVTRLADLRLA